MKITHLPLNALRAFLVSAKYLSFTGAATELCVTQAAVSQLVRNLEAQLNVSLFIRQSRGLTLSEDGKVLYPVLKDAFNNIAHALQHLEHGSFKETVSIGVVGTFALNWLLPRIDDFNINHPFIKLKISTNNNTIEPSFQNLDYIIKFGQGNWPNMDSFKIIEAPFSVLCNQSYMNNITSTQDLLKLKLLRSYNIDEWPAWFKEANISVQAPELETITFDSSITMIEAAIKGYGIALAPPIMFQEHLDNCVLFQPFNIYLKRGGYWLTKLKRKTESSGQILFKTWLIEEANKMSIIK
ncbi:LysR family transcriptional regulator [Vibrio sp. E150_018]